jgi:hypothetical protein
MIALVLLLVSTIQRISDLDEPTCCHTNLIKQRLRNPDPGQQAATASDETEHASISSWMA